MDNPHIRTNQIWYIVLTPYDNGVEYKVTSIMGRTVELIPTIGDLKFKITMYKKDLRKYGVFMRIIK